MLQKKDYSSSENEQSDDYEENQFQNEDIQKDGNFDNFNISQESKTHLTSVGIKYLFPIQQATFNIIYEGKDLIGKDRTGSGKTLAFSLPLLEKYRKQNIFQNSRTQEPFIMVVVPTRELATQVTNEFDRFMNYEGEYRTLCVYGGTDIYD